MSGRSAMERRSGRRIAFVPTMGALHAGHLALVQAAKDRTGFAVASIFVNPLQFNNKEDLAKYPRDLDNDRALLERAGCDVLYAPEADDIFRDFSPRRYDLGSLDNVLEGPSRPGHFQGMINVVERLFHYVRPDVALFGEKDRQQLAVIRHVATQLHWPEEIDRPPHAPRSGRAGHEQPQPAVVASGAGHRAGALPFVERLGGQGLSGAGGGGPAGWAGRAGHQTHGEAGLSGDRPPPYAGPFDGLDRPGRGGGADRRASGPRAVDRQHHLAAVTSPPFAQGCLAEALK
ncbi:MAG: pantoate--beta-alanine ligase [Flavobacteriales bacterium]